MVANPCRNECHPICLVTPVRFNAGWMCRLRIMSGFRTAKLHAMSERERTKKAYRGYGAVCDQFEKGTVPGSNERLVWPLPINIIEEARRLLALAAEGGKLPPAETPYGLPIEEPIQRCRPSENSPEGVVDISWFAVWLARWAFASMLDIAVDHSALALALEERYSWKRVQPRK